LKFEWETCNLEERIIQVGLKKCWEENLEIVRVFNGLLELGVVF